MVFEKDGIKILFIHTPKTAGVFTISLLKSLGFNEIVNYHPKFEEEFKLCIGNYIHAEILSQEYDLSEFSYIFSYFRDPVDRLKSVYRMRHSNSGVYSNFEEFVNDVFEKYQTDSYVEINFIRPQSEFYVDGCKVFSYSRDIKIEFVKDLTYLNYIDINQSPVGEIDISVELEQKIKDFYDIDYKKYGHLI
jgi:hypothetical protein